MKEFLVVLVVSYVAVSQASPVTASQSAGSCDNVIVIERDLWNAMKPRRSFTALETPVRYIFIHHTDTGECHSFRQCVTRVRRIQRFHMYDIGWTDIGYNFLIGGDGYVYEGRGWYKVGAHTPGYNARSISIALIGNFQNKMPTAAQLQATKDLLECTSSRYTTTIDPEYKLGGHKDVDDTLCPGQQLYNEIKRWDHYSSEYP